jgi:hypothetical protein
MQSEILFSAKEKDSLDWDTINRLVDDNRDFKSFLNDLMEDIKVGKIKSRYDRVYEDEETASRELRENSNEPLTPFQKQLNEVRKQIKE